MANRDVTEYRDVTQQVAPQTPNMYQSALEMTTKLADISNEAKINKNISQAQLELNKLGNDFQLKYQSNPTAGADEYRSARDEILNRYGTDISPIYKNQWQEQARQLTARADLSMQNWQFQQSKVNVVNDINTSMENNLLQADLNGQAYGTGKITELNSVLDYQSSYNSIMRTGANVIGEESAKSQMNGYKEKYISDFIGGVASVNSEKAKELLQDEKFAKILSSSDKQNIMSKIVISEAVEQEAKFESYQNKADEAFTKNPFNFMDEANNISGNGDAFRAKLGINRKTYDQVIAYNTKLVERHKTNSYMDFYKNPSKEGLDYLQKLKPEMTETEKDRLTDIYETTPNFEMTTTFSGYESALIDVQKLALMPNETTKQKEEILNKSVDIVHKMKRSNLGSQDKASTLSQDDINELSQTMYKTVDDALFKKELSSLPDIGIFSKISKSVIEPLANDKLISTTYENYNRARNIQKTGYITSSNMVKALMNGDRETADRIYQEGLEKAIKQKYYYLPEMQGKLEPDKTTFKINGKPYIFKGFGSEDIILEKLD